MITQKVSLLDKAKSIKRKNTVGEKINNEHIELALAWADDEIGIRQIQKALGLGSPTAVYSFLAISLKKYIETLK